MGQFAEKTREARLWWFLHIRRKYAGYYWEKDAEDRFVRKEDTWKAQREVRIR